MIIFIINTFFYLINVIQYSIFSQDKLFIKSVLIILLLLIIKIHTIYPKMPDADPFAIADYYRIHTKYKKILTFSILFIYILLFVFGIFYLRISNQQKIIDLKFVWNKFSSDFAVHTALCNIINITLCILLLLVYLYTLFKLLAFVRQYWIKLHIYYSEYKENWYRKYIYGLFCKVEYNGLLINFTLMKYPKIDEVLQKELLGFSLKYHLLMFIRNVHYIIIFVAFIYDVVFCNFVLHTTYYILPYIFIYDLYIRFCNLYLNLDLLYMADFTVHSFIYAKSITVINSDEFWIDGDVYSARGVANAVCVYLRTGLNAKLLCEAYGDKYPFYEFGYYKECKRLKTQKEDF